MRTTEDVFKWHVYKSESKWQGSRSGALCAHKAWGSGDWRAHQCSRKPKHNIIGYNFCTQHAKMVLADLDKLDEGG